MKKLKNNNTVVRFYSSLLNLYPSYYVKEFHAQMLQTFKDHYTDVSKTDGKVGIGFWFDTISDELLAIGREQIQAIHMDFRLSLVVLLLLGLFLGSILISPIVPLFFLYILQVVLLLFVYFSIKKLFSINAGSRISKV